MDSKNKLQFIKKTRPKIKRGDYFCFNINSKFYVGLVVHNQLIAKYGSNIMLSILVLNYCENNIDEISTTKIIQNINDKNLLIPPMNINKLGWSKGFLVNVGNIELERISDKVLNNIVFAYNKKNIYNLDFMLVDDVIDFSLVGHLGTYNYIGLESLLQISLDLEFTEEHDKTYNPYGYYDELATIFNHLTMPFWYDKAKTRLNNPPPNMFF